MAKRRCDNCAYAGELMGRPAVETDPATGEIPHLICVNRIEAPGRMWAVAGSDVCRRFRLKTLPVLRREPPAPPNNEIRYIRHRGLRLAEPIQVACLPQQAPLRPSQGAYRERLQNDRDAPPDHATA